MVSFKIGDKIKIIKKSGPKSRFGVGDILVVEKIKERLNNRSYKFVGIVGYFYGFETYEDCYVIISKRKEKLKRVLNEKK